VTQLRRALAALAFLEAPDPELCCEVQVELCEALFALDAPPLEVGREFEEAARLAQACERWDLFARAVGSNAYYQISKNLVSLIDPQLAPMRRGTRVRIEEALARLGDEHPSLRVALLLGYARLLEREQESERAAAVSDEMLRLTATLDDPGLRARVIAQRCYLHPDLERIDARIDACRSFRELARTAADLSMEIFGHMLEACLELQRGRRIEAEVSALPLLGAEPDPRISAVRPLAHFWRCLMAQLDGRVDEAQTWSSSAAQLGAELNFSRDSLIAVYAAQQWWLLRLEGRIGLSLEPWRVYVEEHPEIPSVRIQLARIYAEVGRLEDARRELERLGPDPLAGIPRDDNWPFFAAVAADVCADVADAERAPRLLALLEPFADRVAMAGWILTTHGAIARPLARLYALLGRRDDAEAHFERALALHRQLASPPLIAWTLLDHACVLAQQGRRGDAARARKLRNAAVQAASSVDLHALAARAKSIL
jgi:tetratricopeptide (TPR) repeat protein